MADQHERHPSEIKRPPFDELQEQLDEKRRDAVKMMRAWAVAEELFATGKSIEFDSMISDYYRKESAAQSAARDEREDNPLLLAYQLPSRERDDFQVVKTSMERAFSKDGVQVVLKAEREARALRNQMESRDRLAQRAQNPQS